MVVILGWAAAAHAEDAAPPPPAGTRTLAGTPFQLVLPQGHLFGDWAGQNGFDGNPVGVFFNAPGMTAYPNATWGGLVRSDRPSART